MVWSRPRRADWRQRDDAFDELVEDYDRQTERNAVMEERRKEREAVNVAAQRERETAETARRGQEAEQLKGELRQRFLSLPGTTPADFEREYPTLLADHRRRAMDQQGDELRQELRRAALRGMNEVD